MNRFFRRLPLPAKLMLIGFLPLLFLVFLSFGLYVEKDQNLAILEKYLDRFEESANLTHLIDNLQLERKYSYEFVLNKGRGAEMKRQRLNTDSLIRELNEKGDSTLKNFENYSFLSELGTTRNNIDSGLIAPSGVMHFYSASIFRLNTLNNFSSGNNSHLRHVYSNMTAQKLISEMITYLGLINANVYNILYTREYIVETLMGTMPSFEVYKSYEKEFRLKASPGVIEQYDKVRYNSALAENISYLDQVFKTYNVDSNYTYESWGKLTSGAVNDLRRLQMNLLQDVQHRMRASYAEERGEKWRTLIFLIFALAVVIALVIYTVHILNTMLNELKQNALKISRGERASSFQNVSNDVIGSLARSISAIDKSNKQLADAANSIGSGNFDVLLQPRSNDDVLGIALLRMKENLQTSTRETAESREQFIKLADFVPQIVWTATNEGYVDYYNKQWYEFTGSGQEYGVESFTRHLYGADIKKCIDTWYKSVRTGEPYEMEYRIRDRHGNYRWFLGRAVPVRNTEGKILKWFGTCTDIHERKNRSEELEELVQQRTRELERSNDDLKQFAHVASHDLKEPMRKIRMFSSRLKDDYSGSIAKEGQGYLDKIQEAAGRMSAMIDGVLNYSVATNADHHFEWIDLNNVIEHIRQDLELVIQQKEASIEYNVLPRIYGINVLIYQLFYNLINNALKFSKPGEKNHITINVKKVKGFEVNGSSGLIPGKDYISIEIKDQGIGFDMDDTEKMFQLFSRLNSKDKYEGTGLGLALCKKIALRHNGNIIAQGKENEGASFNVFLPAGE